MILEQLVAFNIALLAAIASPGPALLVAIRTTLSAGRRAGIATGCGLGLMAAMWTLMALLGLEVVFRLFPWAYTAVKLAGALYLLHIAWSMWRGARSAIQAQARPAKRAFRQGFLINLLNPKSMLFAAAVLIVIFPADLGALAKAVIVLNHLLVEVLFYAGLAFAMSTPRVSRHYLRAKVYLDRTASLVLGALGLRLLVDR